MTDVDGDGNKAFNPFDGGPSILLRQSPPIDFFIGVMCNSLSGYEITLTTGSGTTTTTTGELTSGGGSKMTYSATLSKVNGTFAAGAVASANLDLTGSTASASAVFGSTADLPLEAASPNVWQLAASLPLINSVSDGLMMAGTYSGIITASVSLK
jgi:hypothetical protein